MIVQTDLQTETDRLTHPDWRKEVRKTHRLKDRHIKTVNEIRIFRMTFHLSVISESHLNLLTGTYLENPKPNSIKKSKKQPLTNGSFTFHPPFNCRKSSLLLGGTMTTFQPQFSLLRFSRITGLGGF